MSTLATTSTLGVAHEVTALACVEGTSGDAPIRRPFNFSFGRHESSAKQQRNHGQPSRRQIYYPVFPLCPPTRDDEPITTWRYKPFTKSNVHISSFPPTTPVKRTRLASNNTTTTLKHWTGYRPATSAPLATHDTTRMPSAFPRPHSDTTTAVLSKWLLTRGQNNARKAPSCNGNNCGFLLTPSGSTASSDTSRNTITTAPTSHA